MPDVGTKRGQADVIDVKLTTTQAMGLYDLLFERSVRSVTPDPIEEQLLGLVRVALMERMKTSTVSAARPDNMDQFDRWLAGQKRTIEDMVIEGRSKSRDENTIVMDSNDEISPSQKYPRLQRLKGRHR